MKNNEEKLVWKSYEEKVLEHLLEIIDGGEPLTKRSAADSMFLPPREWMVS